MQKKLKVATIVGTRPELIRLSRVLAVFEECFEHVLIHTGQNYDFELSEIFFRDLKIKKPEYFLNAAGSSGCETVGNVIFKTDEVLRKEMPDAVLILGDTNSCMAAYSAKRNKIPVFHMEAGNRCFDQRVPEEINRKIVDHISDMNLTYSSIAREYLLAEGVLSDRIIKTGSPMFEVLTYNMKAIEASKALEECNLRPREYVLVSAHREENIDGKNGIENLSNILNEIAKRENIPVFVSTHPRTRKKFEEKNIALHRGVVLSKPCGFFDFNWLQMNAKYVLSDSGTITEESSILNFPALNIRDAHERPEGMEEASVMMVGLNIERVFQGIEILKRQKVGVKRNFLPVEDYQNPNVSEKVARIVLSYIDYVNRKIWLKNPSVT